MRNRIWGKAARWTVVVALVLCPKKASGELTAHDYSVEVTARISETPPAITLEWLIDAAATSYEISRKELGADVWTKMVSVSRTQASWTDNSVTPGVAYEYQVIKPTGAGYTGYGYICSAIKRAPVEDRGRMILLVEKQLGESLGFELARLQQDLVGDGWVVIRRDVETTMRVPDVKDVVRGVYEADRERTKGLFIFGHVPIPFSGEISPDNHADDFGAWPADVYYAEFDGQWTDSTVNNTGQNRNVPGDGRFDQNTPPGPVRLQLGRVDLYKLTCFANKTPSRSELDLARQYLTKDHNFRHGQFDVQRRAMIFDRMYRGLELEPQTCAAWRSFPGFFGRDNVRVIGQYEYFPILSNESYLWSYVVSGGSVYGSDYIGTSDAWALNDPKVVFTSFLGSWFGQWDRESDFLRAPLGTSGYTLASIFSGQPQWILHPMGMGETIGYSAMLTQNNPPDGVYPPQLNAGAGQIHIDLMGDPSLRMHTFKPSGRVNGQLNGSSMALSWSPSPDPAVLAYYVYKSRAQGGPFTKISGANPLTATSFTDPAATADGNYMIRALKLEQTPAGSYYNLSQGMFYPNTLESSGVPDAPRDLAVSSITQGAASLDWIPPSANVRGFEIQRRIFPNGVFAKIAELSPAASSFSETNLSAGQYAYRVKALGFAGDSSYSGEAILNFQTPSGTIVGVDKTTGGNWIGKYGDDGYVIIAAATNYPSYVNVGLNNANLYLTSTDTTSDPQTLLRPDGRTRLLAHWLNLHHTPLTVSLRFTDSLVHRVSIYMVDYEKANRSGTLDLIDPFTGRIFQSLYYTNFQAGQYITMDVQNYVDVRLTSTFEYAEPAFFSGMFFSTPEYIGETTASFSGVNTTTRGDWQSKYGAWGKAIAGWNTSLPGEVRLKASLNETWVWSDSTQDPRALSKNVADNSRIASAWYNANESIFDVTIASVIEKQIALYFLDWDRAGRIQDLTVTDPNGVPLLQRRIENFAEGQYVIINAKGKIRISLRRVAGPNAVLAGMFFDTRPMSTEPARMDFPTFNTTSGAYAVRIIGQPGQVFDIQRTYDFRAWTVIGQQVLTSASALFTIPPSAEPGVRFYRAVLAQ